MKKDNLFCFLLIVLLIGNLGFINAELTDISKNLGYSDKTITTTNPDGISYEKTAEGAVITFKGGDVNVNGNEFNKIQSQDTAKHPSFVELDKNGNLISADFSVNEQGGKYVFGDTEIAAPPSSRVLFDEKTGIKIKVQDGAELSPNPSHSNNPDLENYIVAVEGNKFLLQNGDVVSGRLWFDNNGQAFVKAYDEVYLNDVLILPSKNDIYFFSGDDFSPELYKNQNYYYTGSKGDILHSVQGGEVNAEYLAGNKLFNMYKITDADNSGKLSKIPDKNDFLRLHVSSGDSLDISDRSGQGLIPKINHNRDVKDFESGLTSIISGRMTFSIGDNINLVKPDVLSLHPLAQQESVPFQLESELLNQRLKVSSSNVFTILISPPSSDSPTITFNSEGLKVSELISDNEFQTIDQLKKKYPSINFVQSTQPYLTDSGVDKIVPSPYTVQVLDQWFQEDLTRIEHYQTVQFNDEFNAFSAYVSGTNKNTLGMGERVFDPYGDRIRGLPPLGVLVHEDEHSLDYLVKYAESKLLSDSKDLPQEIMDSRAERIRIVEQELNPVKEKIAKRRSDIIPNGLTIQGLILLRDDAEFNNLLRQEDSITNRVLELGAKELEIINSNKETKLLQSFYNDFSYDSSLNLLRTEGESINKYRKIYAETYVFGVKKKYGIDLDVNSVLNTEGEAYVFHVFESKFGRDQREWPEGAEIIQRKGDSIINSNPKIIKDALDYFEKTKTVEGTKKIDVLGTQITQIIDHINQMGIDLSHTGQTEISKEILDLPRQYGLPDVYATRDYSSNTKTSRQFAQNAELSSTYRELPISVRQERIQSTNPYVSDAYKKLTQLAFDSGKMPVSEYRQLMGDNFCSQANCCDQKCVIYKLTCTGSCIE